MGKAVIASTLLLGCAGLFVAASWHTGVRIAATLPALVLQGDTVLQQTLPGSRLTFESLERGVFSSTVRYQLQLRPPGQQGHLSLQLISHIEHGPLPRSRLLRLQWQPVQAFSRSQLVETADSKAWFAASQHLPPLQGEMTLAYDGSHRGRCASRRSTGQGRHGACACPGSRSTIASATTPAISPSKPERPA